MRTRLASQGVIAWGIGKKPVASGARSAWARQDDPLLRNNEAGRLEGRAEGNSARSDRCVRTSRPDIAASLNSFSSTTKRASARQCARTFAAGELVTTTAIAFVPQTLSFNVPHVVCRIA